MLEPPRSAVVLEFRRPRRAGTLEVDGFGVLGLFGKKLQQLRLARNMARSTSLRSIEGACGFFLVHGLRLGSLRGGRGHD
jgi:hypothetical protein